MFGHVRPDQDPYAPTDRKRRSRRGYNMPYNWTPGQTFDVADVGFDLSKGITGGGPIGWNTGLFAGMDLAISTATSAPEEALGRAVGAVTAQASGIASFYGGRMAGRAVGAIVGGALSGGVGAGVGAFVGGAVGSIVTPFLIDPIVRKISKPINRIVGVFQHRVNFGGNFKDSAPAYTMRQRALQELNSSITNATQYMGREAQFMHM